MSASHNNGICTMPLSPPHGRPNLIWVPRPHWNSANNLSAMNAVFRQMFFLVTPETSDIFVVFSSLQHECCTGSNIRADWVVLTQSWVPFIFARVVSQQPSLCELGFQCHKVFRFVSQSSFISQIGFVGVWTFVFILNLFQFVWILNCHHSNCGRASSKRGF